jgi:flagellar M-ring protein FliF
MIELKNLWSGVSAQRRVGLIVGLVLIVAATAMLGTWSLSKNYETLFSDLSEQNASTMVAELDRMKVPYRLESGGTRITVPQEVVHKTRLTLAGKNLPLNGAVGFEIFNNSDFGMTEFTQKVNYQRALQGELTRTIMALEEVQSARVHLVLPESSLFKRDQNRSKASVTLAVKPGHALAQDQVMGIQRLVSAAVPGIEAGDVTVIDQRGATLSHRTDVGSDAGFGQLDTKRRVEEHLARKVSTMLDRAFGPGQGVVSVDVALNFDQIKVTTEEVLGSKGAPDAQPAGVVTRERQTNRETPNGKNAADVNASVVSTETDYQTGRRVEQLVSAPGSIKRIQIGVVVPPGVPQDRLERIQQVVSMAAGLDRVRGDAIAVYALDQVAGAPALKPTGVGDAPVAAPISNERAVREVAPQASPLFGNAGAVALLGVLAVVMFVAYVLGARRRPTALAAPVLAAPQTLPEAERTVVLDNLRLWLEAPAATRSAEQTK